MAGSPAATLLKLFDARVCVCARTKLSVSEWSKADLFPPPWDPIMIK